MRTFVATVKVEFTCSNEAMVRDRIMGIPFGDHDCGFQITKIREKSLKRDATLSREYRQRHGLEPSDVS